MALLRATARWLAAPLLLGGAVTVSFAAGRWALGPALMAGLVSVPLLGLVWLLERALPHRPEWNRPDGQALNDLGHALFGTGLGGAIGNAMTEAVFSAAGLWLLASLHGSLWPSSLPAAVQVVLIFLLADLGRFVQHWLLHRVPWLWRFHSLHHSGDVLTTLKTSRSHLVERVTQQLFMFGPLTFLGAPPGLVICFVIPNSFFGLFSHCNADLELGPLELILMGPKSHRLHHSADAYEGNCNFGSALVVWDRLFGTFADPRVRGSPRRVGIVGDTTPRGFWAQVFEPFLPRPPRSEPAAGGSTG